MAKQKRKKLDLLEKTFSFLFLIFSDCFHRALWDLKEMRMKKLESSRLPTLERLNKDIKRIVGAHWNEQVEVALCCVQSCKKHQRSARVLRGLSGVVGNEEIGNILNKT